MSTLGYKDPAMLQAASALADSFKSSTKGGKGKASKKQLYVPPSPAKKSKKKGTTPGKGKVMGRSMKDLKWEVRTELPTVLGSQGLDFLHRNDASHLKAKKYNDGAPVVSQSPASIGKVPVSQKAAPICEPRDDLLTFEPRINVSSPSDTTSVSLSPSGNGEPTTPSESSVSNILDTFHQLMMTSTLSGDKKNTESPIQSILDIGDERDVYDDVIALADAAPLEKWPVLTPNACNCMAKYARKGLASSLFADENVSKTHNLGKFTALDESLMHEASCPLNRSQGKDLMRIEQKTSSLRVKSTVLRPDALEFIPGLYN